MDYLFITTISKSVFVISYTDKYVLKKIKKLLSGWVLDCLGGNIARFEREINEPFSVRYVGYNQARNKNGIKYVTLSFEVMRLTGDTEPF